MNASRSHSGQGVRAYGPWAVVTGASSGIGRAMAEHLAREGVNVVLVARRRDVLESVAATIRAASAVATRVIAEDLSTMDGATAVLEATSDLDVGLLVAAAGVGTSGPLLSAPLDVELQMLDLNCRALLVHTHGFGRRFVERGRGGLVLMASLVGFQGVPYAAHYSATKAYVQSLAEALRVELADSGVDVIASAPGPVHSEFAERAGMHFSAAVSPAHVARATLQALGRRSAVTPGFLSKVLTYSLAPLPRSIRTRIMGQVMRSMTH